MRIGQGYDIHRLEEGRPFVLGGVRISSGRGPVGHSDGDPLLHALTDALLGALALGDIGQHFPDTDERYRGKESAFFLAEVLKMVHTKNFVVANVDSTVILQAPKLAEYIAPIRRKIAALLEVAVDQVSVKAKTNEQLDALGRAEGVAVHAVVLLDGPSDANPRL